MDLMAEKIESTEFTHNQINCKTEFTYKKPGWETEFIFKQLSWEEVKEDAARLRFQVLCYECGFISDQDFPQKKELDEYDEHCCAHFGVFADNELIGYSRLILAGQKTLPILTKCPDVKQVIKGIPVKNIAEVSRLIISKKFRKRIGDGLYCETESYKSGHGKNESQMNRRILPMVLGLYKAMYIYSKFNNIRYFLALMEPFLPRLLKNTGEFQVISEPVELWGTVYPYILDLRQAEEKMNSNDPEFLEYFISELPEYLKPKF